MQQQLMSSPPPANSALQRYDARKIAAYYRWRPWKALWRLIYIISLFSGFIWGLLWDRWTHTSTAHSPQRAIQIRKILTQLGPTFIKVGQALSTRPDLIPKDFLTELMLLQDQLPPFPNEQAFAQIEAELRQPVREIYQEISAQPVAAASLGQVYRGRLFTGEEVAIKVQRPNLRPKLTLDLYLMRWMAARFGRFLPLNLGHDLTLIVDEFGTKLFEEIDYINEGQNAERFAENFKEYPAVEVPRIHWAYSSKRVLTLQWINGFKLTDSQCAVDANMDPDRLVQIGVISSLRQLLEFGFFHADPHPGNLFATSEGSMAYVDFGMMDQLDQTTKNTLVDAVVHLVNKDYELLATDFVKLGFLTPETDIRPIIPALEDVFDDIIGAKVGDFNFKTITDRFSELMYDYPFRVPAKFALIIRSLVTQEGVALCLNPDFKILEVSYPYVAQRLLAGETPDFQRRLLEVLFKDGKFQWQRLENLIAIAQTDQSFDLIPTARLGMQFLMSDEGDYLRRQVVLALIEDDRLHTEEVERLWNLIKGDLKPEKLFSVALGALAEFSDSNLPEWLPRPPLPVS
ncbi:AarF/ABC1/UbiB kinase family protein [Acaryochloris sp. CCMEE 5410]|uniref:ABC1 kinase family protein n=1 Tax=Acaryochloris sp. CCMEE 5410 TaxID=310037 RepID=UPI0002483C24|nr:AarF/ABC1/UbiB kinase family protein [Acaryochloris sp. CCMEE 5410]